MRKNASGFAALLVIWGCCTVGAHTKWQLGLAAFFIAAGVMLYAREK